MPLMPRKVKYRKSQRGSRAGNANRGTKLSFGDYGLQTLERGTEVEAQSNSHSRPDKTHRRVRY